MWCEKCNYGSVTYKPYQNKCSMCGNKTFDSGDPFPRKPLRSIRQMSKRIRTETDHKTKKPISTEVSEVISDAGKLK